ncbi:MAG: hypothetical protein K2Y26_19115 [Gemmatimonadaceae bacterium]|nr:hypothetical protein [Gemmatimonadaceae bacterium]
MPIDKTLAWMFLKGVSVLAYTSMHQPIVQGEARYQASDKPARLLAVAGQPFVLGAGRDDGPYEFIDVVGAFYLSADRLMVADGKSSQLRVFGVPDGRHLRTVGGVGQGPGEISDLWVAWRLPSGVVAEDGAGKASVFDLRGNFVRVLPRGVDASGRRVERIGVLNDTLSVGKLLDTLPSLKPGESRMLGMQLLAVTARSSRLIARYDERLLLRGPTGRARTPVFGATSIVAVAGGRVCVGYTARYVIDCYSADGKHLTRTERRGIRPSPVRSMDKEYFFASEAAANPGPEGASYVARLRSTVSFSETMPLFGEFVAASNGDLWVGPYVPVGPIPMKRPFPTTPTTWSVYGVDGRWKADATLPERFQLLSVDGMRAVGVRRDQDDVESIVVYTLRVQQ